MNKQHMLGIGIVICFLITFISVNVYAANYYSTGYTAVVIDPGDLNALRSIGVSMEIERLKESIGIQDSGIVSITITLSQEGEYPINSAKLYLTSESKSPYTFMTLDISKTNNDNQRKIYFGLSDTDLNRGYVTLVPNYPEPEQMQYNHHYILGNSYRLNLYDWWLYLQSKIDEF